MSEAKDTTPAEVVRTDTVNLSALARLREAFPAEQVDKLPRGVNKDQPKASCNVCGGYHEPASVHLDYVGHARVTERLLNADPTWTWEPLAFDEHGLPLLSRDPKGAPYGLWIRLTIGGMTRLGFGEVPASKGADGIKEGIGDAIRNAAMRFGVALELWMKEAPESERSARPRKTQAAKPKPQDDSKPLARVLQERLWRMHEGDTDAVVAALEQFYGDKWKGSLAATPLADLARLQKHLDELARTPKPKPEPQGEPAPEPQDPAGEPSEPVQVPLDAEGWAEGAPGGTNA